MSILITGGAGYIGSFAVAALREHGDEATDLEPNLYVCFATDGARAMPV